MKSRRIHRLNSLLKEVVSEVILRDLNNPNLVSLISVTQVDISPDLHNAKVYISMLGNDQEKNKTLKALNDSAPYIAVCASKKITIRYFPRLEFFIDNSLDQQMKIDALLQKIKKNEHHHE